MYEKFLDFASCGHSIVNGLQFHPFLICFFRHPTISAQYVLYLGVKSELFVLVTQMTVVPVIMVILCPSLIIRIVLFLLFLSLLSVCGRIVVHVHSIKLSSHFVLGASPLSQAIISNSIIGILDTRRLKVINFIKFLLLGSFTLTLEGLQHVGLLQVEFDYGGFLTFYNLEIRVVTQLS